LRVSARAARHEVEIEVEVGELRALLDRLVRDFSAEATRAIARRGFFAVALPGGSVADHAFPALARLPLAWDQIHFFWSDERAVPPSDPASNYAVAQSSWLGPARVPAASIHRMPADTADLASAARAYEDELTRLLGPSARLDYALLGVGADGHVASLFPGRPAACDERQRVIPVLDSPKAPIRRLTLSLPLLGAAERVVVMALGESKAGALRDAILSPDSSLPVAQLLRRAAHPLVLVDEGAASAIKQAGWQRDRAVS
jgi:6-phosphogluconolactonase